MKTLHEYLRKQLYRTDPYAAIDHSLRAELHEDGRISFYIHASGRDSETCDFWADEDGTIREKRLADEPLPEAVREKVLAATKRFGSRWAIGDNQRLMIPDTHGVAWEEVKVAIESIESVDANYLGFNDHDWEFKPRFGKLFSR